MCALVVNALLAFAVGCGLSGAGDDVAPAPGGGFRQSGIRLFWVDERVRSVHLPTVTRDVLSLGVGGDARLLGGFAQGGLVGDERQVAMLVLCLSLQQAQASQVIEFGPSGRQVQDDVGRMLLGKLSPDGFEGCVRRYGQNRRHITGVTQRAIVSDDSE